MTLTPGANAPLSDNQVTLKAHLPTSPEVDITLLQIYDTGKVRGDDDMCFYGQPSIGNGAVKIDTNSQTLTLALNNVHPDVQKIMITATIDGPQTFGDLPQNITLNGPVNLETPCSGRAEKALILAEIYKNKGQWKIRNVSQGFNGGLKALAEHFGMDIAEEEAPATGNTIDLTKRLADIEKKDPDMVSLVKKVGISLDKKGGTPERAKVCLCLDISGSMHTLYKSGKIDALVKRVLALGLTFDDDGDIDVFLFGQKVHEYGTVDVTNYKTFSADVTRKHRLEGGTRYGLAMERIRSFYSTNNPENLPVFVMFVTDGGTDDKPKTKKMLVQSSKEPFFWKMMGIIPDNRWSKGRSGFLQELDDLPGRDIDNCDFFNVTDPAGMPDEEFFDNVMEEYPEWVKEAKAQNLI